MAADEQHVTRFNLRIKAYILQSPVSTLCIREKQFSDKFVIRGQRKKKKEKRVCSSYTRQVRNLPWIWLTRPILGPNLRVLSIPGSRYLNVTRVCGVSPRENLGDNVRNLETIARRLLVTPVSFINQSDWWLGNDIATRVIMRENFRSISLWDISFMRNWKLECYSVRRLSSQLQLIFNLHSWI